MQPDEDLPRLEELPEDQEEDHEQDDGEDPGAADGEDLDLPHGDGLHPLQPGEGDRPGEAAHECEEREEPEFNVFRLCMAMPGKTSRCTLEAINRMHIQLRVLGYHVAQVHTDRGGEFRGRPLD